MSSSSSSSSANNNNNSKQQHFHESLNVLDLQDSTSHSNDHDGEDDSECFKAGVGYQSFTSFEEQLRAARKREEVRLRKEAEEKLGGSRVSIKDRLKMFEKNSNSAST